MTPVSRRNSTGPTGNLSGPLRASGIWVTKKGHRLVRGECGQGGCGSREKAGRGSSSSVSSARPRTQLRALT
eukprot:11185976-Lingulodinium_polyedra.AAC.1